MLIQILRDGLRSFARARVLAVSMTATLAVALAAVVVASTLTSVVFLRPLPFRNAERLYSIQRHNAAGEPVWLSRPTFEEWQEQTPSFETLTAFTGADFTVLGGEHAESILASLVSPTFFETVGIGPGWGRGFGAREHHSDGERVVILSHAFWQRRFGGSTTILGQPVRLTGPEYLEGSDGTYTVVGIMPERFWLFWQRFDVLIPLPAARHFGDRQKPVIERVFGRLRPDASADAIDLELTRVKASLERQLTQDALPTSVVVKPLQEAHFADMRPIVGLLGVTSLMVLLLAAVNVATMLLAYGIARQRELAVRLALGASRTRLAVQGGVEGLVLAISGGTGGLVLGAGALDILRSSIPSAHLTRIPGEAEAIALDGTVIVSLLCVVALLAGVLGFVSVSTGFSRRIFESLKQSLTTAAPGRLGTKSLLVGVQLSLSLALVLTSWVLVHNAMRLASVDLGVQPDGLVAAWVNLSPSRHPDLQSRSLLYDRVLERVGAIAGVVRSGAIDLPYQHAWQITRVRSRPLADADEAQLPRVQRRSASEHYFATVGIPLVHGRIFASTDLPGNEPVAVVSRSLARRLWPDRDPLGQHVRLDGEPDAAWLRVIGVVDDIRSAPDEEPALVLYQPLRQAPPPWLYVFVRASGDPSLTFGPLKQAVWAVDRDQPVEGPWLVSTWMSNATAPVRFVALFASGFAFVGAIIAAAGVYSLTAFSVNRAKRDIAIRKALGATTRDVLALFVRRSATIAVPASLVGIGLSMCLVRVLGSSIEGVRPAWNPEMGAAVAAFLVLVVVATLLPTRKAAEAQPGVALRSE